MTLTTNPKGRIMHSISRQAVIRSAFKALDDKNVSDVDRGHLLYTACTVKQIALHDWVIDRNCGCLVGSMLLQEAADKPNPQAEVGDALVNILDEADVRSRSLLEIGLAFDEALEDEMAAESGYLDSSAPERLEVVDV